MSAVKAVSKRPAGAVERNAKKMKSEPVFEAQPEEQSAAQTPDGLEEALEWALTPVASAGPVAEAPAAPASSYVASEGPNPSVAKAPSLPGTVLGSSLVELHGPSPSVAQASSVPGSAVGASVDPVSSVAEAPKICEVGADLMERRSMTSTIPIEDLGPAVFNRNMVGDHVLELMHDIIKKFGFAKWRYGAIFVHAPNPQNPLEVAEWGNKQRRLDPRLPQLPKKHLYGVFAGQHLVAGLQLVKQAQTTCPHSQEIMRPSMCNEEMQEAMSKGLTCYVWAHETFVAFQEEFSAFMSAANTRALTDMAEDEMTLLHRMELAWTKVQASGGSDPVGGGPAAQTQGGRTTFERVMAEVHRTGAVAFSPEETRCLWEFLSNTPPEVLHVFKGLGLHAVIAKPAKWGVQPAFFKLLVAKTPVYPWLGASILCLQYCSDPATEGVTAGGASRTMANGIVKMHWTFFGSVQESMKEYMEDKTSSMMMRYVVPQSELLREDLEAVAKFMCSVGRVATGKSKKVKCSDGGLSPVEKAFASYERDLRKALKVKDDVPSVITQPEAESSAQPKGGSKAVAGSPPSAPLAASPIKFQDGKVVKNASAKCLQRGITEGCSVTLTQQWNDYAKDTIGVVQTILEDSVSVVFVGGSDPCDPPVSFLKVHHEKPSKKNASKDATDAEEPEKAPRVAEPTPYELCSPDQSKDMVKSWIMCAMWRTYTSSGSGPDDVVFLDNGVCIANKDFVPGSLMLIPFVTQLFEFPPPRGVQRCRH